MICFTYKLKKVYIKTFQKVPNCTNCIINKQYLYRIIGVSRPTHIRAVGDTNLNISTKFILYQVWYVVFMFKFYWKLMCKKFDCHIKNTTKISMDRTFVNKF